MLPAPPAPPFVKVCGFTDPANLRAICEADARPDAVGLNFWDGSKRHAPRAAWRSLFEAAGGTSVWGLWVDERPRWLWDHPCQGACDVIQLHGDEPPNRTAVLRGCRVLTHLVHVVRAWRVNGSLDPLLDHLAAAEAAGGVPDAVLLDAAVPGAYGGTGAKLDWHALRGELDRVGDRLPPVILAGGLTPQNVAEAVRVVRPWGVDVAGGVEAAPGVKDPAKVAAFVAAARDAAAEHY